MSFTYILHKHAQKDYEQSLEWYLEHSIDAAEKFVRAVDNALLLICENPFRWRNKYKEFHEITLKTYPFTIIYAIDEEESLIIITSICHHKRNPKGKYRRT